MKKNALFLLGISTILSLIACNKPIKENRNPINDARINEDMKKSLKTLKRIDDKGILYTMDVQFDYFSDAMQTIAEEQNYINHEHGCTSFMTHNENGDVIYGRNFDTNHSAKTLEQAQGIYIIYNCHQEGLYKSVSIADAKYLVSDSASYLPGSLDDGEHDISNIVCGIYDPLDGMNEKGLCVSTLSSDRRTDEVCYNVMVPGQETCVLGTIMRHMLDKCKTVEEAVDLADDYNVMPYTGSSKLDHLLVSDANGKSKVIEWRYNEIRVRDTDIATNFFQTWDDAEPHKVKTSIGYEQDSTLSKTYMDYQYGYGHGYERFNMVASTFQQYAQIDEEGHYSSHLTNELAKNLLSLVAQQMTPEMTSMTQYSVIYNAKTLSADIWLTRDYSKKYSFGI